MEDFIIEDGVLVEYVGEESDVVIPDGVTAIGDEAFYGDESLTSIVIPDSVTNIGYHAFAGCDLLIIYCEVSSKPSGWSESWNSSHRPVVWDCNNNEVADNDSIYYVLNGIRYTLRGREATVEGQPNNLSGKVVLFKNIVYNGKTYKVTSIEEGAFYGCESLTSIVIPDSVISIGEGAFSDTNLIQEENGIYYVDKWVVGCDSSLKHVKLRNNTVGIAALAFYECESLYGCESLTSITIPDSVKNINCAFGSFEDFANINVIQEENGVYYVDKWVVGCDSSLNHVKLRNNTVGIAGGAFGENDSITSIVMPDSVTSIGSYAFKSCYLLASITIPAGVTSIGNHAFYKCSSLTSIKIPDSVTSIGDDAFNGCSKLESITVEQGNPIYHSSGNCLIETKSKTLIAGCKNSIIPADGSVTSIGWAAFANSVSLTSVTIPYGITNIGGYAFVNCQSLTSIVIPDSVTEIDGWAFLGCNSLKTIEYTGSEEQWEWVKKGDGWNEGKAEIVYLGKNIQKAPVQIDNTDFEIEDGVLVEYVGDESEVVIPDGVTAIGDYAFEGCKSLTSIVIPKGVTSIGDYAFWGCSVLTSITIPASITSIGEKAFIGCNSLIIYCEASSKPSGWHSNWNFWECPVVWDCNNNDIADDGNIYCVHNGIRYRLRESEATVDGQPNNLSGKMVLPKSISYNGNTYNLTSIGDWAFDGCSSLTSIVIPGSVTSIGEDAFSGCSSLTSIVIPEGVTSIGESAFSGCSLLTSITIPDSVTSIGDKAFSGCSLLTSIIIPDSVTSIGEDAFDDCSSLTSITIPAGVTSIGNHAFDGCSSLESITIPNSVTSIGDYAFWSCSSLTSITAEQGNPIYHSAGNCLIETKSKTLIAGCKNSVIPVGGSVTSIGDYAFYYCDSLTSITIPESVTSMGEGAFWGCSSLTGITIPDSVTEIEGWAFSGCDSLKTIEYKGTEEQWENVEKGEDWKPKDTQVICTGTYYGNSKSI